MSNKGVKVEKKMKAEEKKGENHLGRMKKS